MRDLLLKINPTLWSEISGIVFCISFVLLLIWVFLPARKKTYEQDSLLPFENNKGANNE